MDELKKDFLADAALAGDEHRGVARGHPAREVEHAGWPRLEVVDLRDEPPGQILLSEGLARALHRTVDAGARALCILNRKGRARLIACGSCHDLARCEACGAAVAEIAGPDGARVLAAKGMAPAN